MIDLIVTVRVGGENAEDAARTVFRDFEEMECVQRLVTSIREFVLNDAKTGDAVQAVIEFEVENADDAIYILGEIDDQKWGDTISGTYQSTIMNGWAVYEIRLFG